MSCPGEFMRNSGIVFTTVVLFACASDAGAEYVSPVTYNGHNCVQLGHAAQFASHRAVVVARAQERRTKDNLATGYWPPIYLQGRDDPLAAELSQLKVHIAAIEQASIQKGCHIQFERQPEAAVRRPLRGSARR